MANKRLKKKQQKQIAVSALKRKGYKEKEIRSLSKSEIEKAYKKEQKRLDRNAKARKEYNLKRKYIQDNNLSSVSLQSIWTKKTTIKKPSPSLSWKELEKIKRKGEKDAREKDRIRQLVSAGYPLQDIKQSDVSSQKATDSIINRLRDSGYDVDWNRVYYLDEPILFMYRDITQETNLATIIRDYLTLPIDALLRELFRIVQLPQTYVGKGSNSSGGCGQGKVYMGDDNDYRYNWDEMNEKTKWRDNRKRKYKGGHHKKYLKYDKINGGNITKTTLKNLIAIAVAILNNIFEGERPVFYNDFRALLIDIEPKVESYIPEPEQTY